MQVGTSAGSPGNRFHHGLMGNGVILFAAGVATALVGVSALSKPSQQVGSTVADFPDLGKGLMETPGCLGVTSFNPNGTKQVVIAAWFENRKAMERWYYGPMHSEAMAKFFPKMGNGHKPFAAFTDEKSPMLVVASVTPGDKPIGNGSDLRVAQIAIEGYAPIPGGVAFGGTFAPSKMTVPGLFKIVGGRGK